MHRRFDKETQDGELQHRFTPFAWLVTTVRRVVPLYRFDILATTRPGVGARLVAVKPAGDRALRGQFYPFDGAVTCEDDGATAVVTGDIHRQRQCPGRDGVGGRLDDQVRAFDIGLLHVKGFRGTAQD